MSDPVSRSPGDHVRAVARTLFGRRSLITGGLFLASIVALGGRARGTPNPPRDATAVLPAESSTVVSSFDAGSPGIVRADGDAETLSTLLARYDALIRVAELRALHRSERGDSAVTELRALRVKTYSAARRALTEDTPPGSGHR